jgi:hypothetical protein
MQGWVEGGWKKDLDVSGLQGFTSDDPNKVAVPSGFVVGSDHASERNLGIFSRVAGHYDDSSYETSTRFERVEEFLDSVTVAIELPDRISTQVPTVSWPADSQSSLTGAIGHLQIVLVPVIDLVDGDTHIGVQSNHIWLGVADPRPEGHRPAGRQAVVEEFCHLQNRCGNRRLKCPPLGSVRDG